MFQGTPDRVHHYQAEHLPARYQRFRSVEGATAFSIMAAMSAPETTQVTPVEAAVPAPGDGELVEDDLLVEEISIDGMCGVY